MMHSAMENKLNGVGWFRGGYDIDYFNNGYEVVLNIRLVTV